MEKLNIILTKSLSLLKYFFFLVLFLTIPFKVILLEYIHVMHIPPSWKFWNCAFQKTLKNIMLANLIFCSLLYSTKKNVKYTKMQRKIQYSLLKCIDSL